MIDGYPRSGTIEAFEPGEALTIAATDFCVLLESSPPFTRALVRALIRRFRDADRKRVEFGAAQTLGRVASRLIELCEEHGEDADEGIVITLPLSQEELAGWVGSSREGVAGALQKLRELGLVATARRRLTVLDLDGLRALA